MYILLSCLLLILKRVKPSEWHRIDVILVRRNREPGLYRTKGFIVILQEITPSRRRIGGSTALDVGAELLQSLEIVLQILRLAFRIIDYDEVTQRPVEIERVCLFLEDRQHDISGGGRRRRRHGLLVTGERWQLIRRNIKSRKKLQRVKRNWRF